jgi:hypothetical protein
MDTEAIIKELEAERIRLDQAITGITREKARSRKPNWKRK